MQAPGSCGGRSPDPSTTSSSSRGPLPRAPLPVPSVAAADAVVARVRKEHWDARHHCVALVVGPHADQQRSTDDGEPSGTAGIPMLEVLRHRHVTDVVAVVTRYFGGVLLGAGGLVRAYRAR